MRYINSLFLVLLFQFSYSQEKIKIGLLLPLSGENKNIGTSVLRSISMAVNKIDSSKIEILPKNNFDDPEQNFKAAKELYENAQILGSSQLNIFLKISIDFFMSLTNSSCSMLSKYSWLCE